MKAEIKISVKDAIRLLKESHNISITIPTMIRWCKAYGLGIQLGPRGRWVVDPLALQKFVTEGTYEKEKTNGAG